MSKRNKSPSEFKREAVLLTQHPDGQQGPDCPNDYQFKLVKIQGEFVWHTHLDVEPRGIVNTGDVGGALTAPNDVWV